MTGLWEKDYIISIAEGRHLANLSNMQAVKDVVSLTAHCFVMNSVHQRTCQAIIGLASLRASCLRACQSLKTAPVFCCHGCASATMIASDALTAVGLPKVGSANSSWPLYAGQHELIPETCVLQASSCNRKMGSSTSNDHGHWKVILPAMHISGVIE